MKFKPKLLFMAAFFVLAIPFVFAGSTQAIYLPDGAEQNGTTGLWDLPADRGKCVTGIAADGTMTIDATKTSRADCIANLQSPSTYTTQALCGVTTNPDGAHFWASTCSSGTTGISLSGLDRTSAMCTANGGIWASKCTSAWYLMGPSGAGTEGFCYASVDVTSTYGDQASCIAAGIGFSWSTSGTSANSCIYAYGIGGGLNGAKSRSTGNWDPIKNLAGGTTVAAHAALPADLTTYTNMGTCITDGFSWNNTIIQSGTTTIGSATVATLTSGSASTTMCLRCHNNTSQYNSYAERWKQDYTMTGHKNMLRKVTPGMNWAGPDSVVYTQAAVPSGATAGDYQTLDFGAGTATTTLWGTKPLMYLFGDWMAPAPDGLYTVVWMGTYARYNGVGSGYSCASCHATGWRNETTTVGLCSISSKTTQATCEAALGTWYPSTGVQGYGIGGLEPGTSFPSYAKGGSNPDKNSIAGITGQWDQDGIICSRCHASTVPAVYSGTTAVTSTHNLTPSGSDINNLCYSCHQSVAKETNGTGVNNDLTHPEYLPVKNTATAPAYIPEFSGHVLGGSFLNSPHGQFTGTIVPNSLGKYDIVSGGTYASNFKDSFCRSGTGATGSILSTNANGTKITTSTQCADAGGTWWANQSQGNCTTCHDVHQSLFDPAATEPLRRECVTCHTTEATTPISHKMGTGTPQEDMSAEAKAESCKICHMPKATSGGFPMHLWRINTDDSYSTFPTALEFGIGGTATKKIANMVSDDAHSIEVGGTTYTTTTYANAAWVDVDYACGQCHGGGTNWIDNPPLPGTHWISKVDLAVRAEGIHKTQKMKKGGQF
ncbi:MAG: hypothetical protein HY752_01530 [Nitrospirae bacterium]|nr:hypothetical protein [Nitrospirota bacterium]